MACIATVVQAAPGATGNQSFTVSGFGTPVAAMFRVTSGTTIDTDAAGLIYSYGATDLTNEWCLYFQCQDGVGTSNTDNGMSATECIAIMTKGTNSKDGQATVVGTVTDGIQINWSNVPSSAYLVECVLFGGDITNAHADVVSLGNTVQTVDITAPAFQPNVVFTAGGDGRGAGGSVPVVAMIYGMAVDNGVTVDQGSLWWFDRNNRGTMDIKASYDGTAMFHARTSAGATDYEVVGTDFDANGFSADVQSAGANNTGMGYLCLDVFDADLNIFDSGSGTGDKAYTCGFTPDGVTSISTVLTSGSPFSNGAAAESYSIGTTTGTGASDEHCATAFSDDGVGTSNTDGRMSNGIVRVHDGSGVVSAATTTSMDATGYTFNYSTNATASSIRIDVAMADDSGAGPSRGPMVVT